MQEATETPNCDCPVSTFRASFPARRRYRPWSLQCRPLSSETCSSQGNPGGLGATLPSAPGPPGTRGASVEYQKYWPGGKSPTGPMWQVSSARSCILLLSDAGLVGFYYFLNPAPRLDKVLPLVIKLAVSVLKQQEVSQKEEKTHRPVMVPGPPRDLPAQNHLEYTGDSRPTPQARPSPTRVTLVHERANGPAGAQGLVLSGTSGRSPAAWLAPGPAGGGRLRTNSVEDRQEAQVPVPSPLGCPVGRRGGHAWTPAGPACWDRRDLTWPGP